jgi:hypothetical protein
MAAGTGGVLWENCEGNVKMSLLTAKNLPNHFSISKYVELTKSFFNFKIREKEEKHISSLPVLKISNPRTLPNHDR